MMAKERPILFSGPMVQALRDGRKTMTRRVVKKTIGSDICPEVLTRCRPMRRGGYEYMGYGENEISLKPYRHPGDWLWVREAIVVDDEGLYYAAEPQVEVVLPENFKGDFHIGTIPSIHMPRWASRITLEVTSVRVGRVQEITDMDAIAEGVEPSNDMDGRLCWLGKNNVWHWHARDAFTELWDSINAKRGYGWDVNPWVWAVGFKIIKGLGDEVNCPNAASARHTRSRGCL